MMLGIWSHFIINCWRTREIEIACSRRMIGCNHAKAVVETYLVDFWQIVPSMESSIPTGEIVLLYVANLPDYISKPEF